MLFRCLAIYWSMFKIGAVGFGGGMAMMPLFQREFVKEKRWLTDEEFIHVISTTLAVPGPFGVNLAILVGHHYLGARGAVFGLIGVLTAPMCYAVAVGMLFFKYAKLPEVNAFMTGASTAVIGLIAYAAFTLGQRMIANIWALLICALAVAAVTGFHVHPLIVLGCATLLAALVMRARSSSNA